MSDDIGADLAQAFEAQVAPEARQEAKPEPEERPADDGVTEPEASAEPEQEAAPEPEEDKPMRAPEGLRPEFKARFAELSKEWQEEILRREQDAARGIGELSEKAKVAKELDRVTAPYEPMIATLGVSKPELIRNFMQTAYVLSHGTPEQKSAVVRGIMSQYQVQVDQPEPEAVDPQVAQLRQEVATLRESLNGGRQQEAVVVQQQAANDVHAFAQDPAHEFFSDVRADMALLVNSGRATDLKDAYEKACRMNPEVWDAIQLKGKRQDLAAKAREAKAAKESAKQVAGSGPREETRPVYDDPRDDLRELIG